MERAEVRDCQALVKLIRECGGRARELQGQALPEYKADGTLVTEMDRELESRLREFFHERFPEHRVLGEEGGLTGPERSPWTWVIDPIDGTTNYMMRLPIWAVSVALLRAGVAQWGCVYLPVLDQIFLARSGGGATRNGEPIAPMRRDRLKSEDLFGVTSDGIKRYEFRFPQKIRAVGSAAAQAAFVACGHYVGYFLDVWHVWDIAAAVLIAQEAGAKVTDRLGVDFSEFLPLGPEKGRPLLFATPGIHAQLLALIEPKGRD